MKNDKTKDEKQNKVSRKEIEFNLNLTVVFTLWGTAVGFLVQVAYDYFGSVLSSVAKFYLGIVIVVLLLGTLVLYMRHLTRLQKRKKH